MHKIYISAGESSGDLLGANLARQLLAKNPALQLTGMGGPRMRDAGVSIQFDPELLAVIGFGGILSKLPRILYLFHRIKKYLKENKPDLVILIDLPDSHFRIMKTAKKLGIPVLYYVSPQLWAWRSGRIKQIQRYVDHMFVLFSFEEKIYRDAHVPVTFVGHPLAQSVRPTMTREDAYAFFHLNANHPVVALFPGSRRSEMTTHLPIILKTVERIASEKPETQFMLVLADRFDEASIRAQLPSDIKIVRKHVYDLLQITTAALAVSGTVTLEIALMQVPLCIIYKTNRLTFWIAKRLMTIRQIGLCNIVAEKLISTEFIQDNVTPDNIAAEMRRLMSDDAYRHHVYAHMQGLRNKIRVDDKDASEKVADVTMQYLH